LVVGLLCIYIFLRFPSGRSWSDRLNKLFVLDLLLVLLTAGTIIYTLWGVWVSETIHLNFHALSTVVRWDHIVGVIVVLLALEATRRSFGWIMVIIPSFFILFALNANYFPAPLKHAPADWSYMMEVLYVTENGVYGTGTAVLLTMVFLFLLFGVVMRATSVGAFFTSLANGVMGGYSGGPAKGAVLASAGLGTLTGSIIANVATTGAITIPMMKRMGYQPQFAAAVETCASSGGQFMPPVMGIAAFLMVAFTGIPYLKICLYVAIPAMLYFLGVFLQVHFRSKKDGLVGLSRAELPSPTKVLAQGWHLVLPLLVIVIALALGFSITRVAIWGIISIVLLSFVRKETRLNARRLLTTLEWGADSSVMISMSVVMVGVIVGSLMVTGLGAKLSYLVEDLAQGNLILGLLLAAAVSLILGMGLPTMMVYLLLVVFVIPAIISMGVPVIAAHLFAFIFGAASMFTPPVCLGAFTAAGIAGSPPMKTGFAACRLGFAAYIVPFMFVFDPHLVLVGTGGPLRILLSVITAIAGITCIAAGLESWLLTRAPFYQRILLITAGICLVAPPFSFKLTGLGLLALVILLQALLIRGRTPEEKMA